MTRRTFWLELELNAHAMKAVGDIISSSSNVNTVIVRWSIALEENTSSDEVPDFVVIATLTDEISKQKYILENPVRATVGESMRPQVSGTSEFHFLCAGHKYSFDLQVEGSDILTHLTVDTPRVASTVQPFLSSQLPAEMWPTYVGEEHQLGEWLSDCPEDIVWTTNPVSYRLLQSLWTNACFTLPSPAHPIVTCPNPISRYCLDLTKGCPWLRSKKVRRHKDEFYLTVDANYVQTFLACEETHRLGGNGSWITRELVDALDRCRKENGDLKVYSIELWEKDGDKMAAAIMALSLGDIFHDYTTATMIRDARSPGAILTKVVGHLLAECGYTLWYWGFKNPYMAEYDGKFGGMQLDNKREFWPKWRQAATGVDAQGKPYPRPPSFREFVLSKCSPGDEVQGRLYLSSLQ